MCGIAGINLSNEPLIRKAAESLKHRGPDAAGIWCGAGISLAHTRLSIIDLDVRSHQPMWDAENKFAIIFNGEIYNYLELKKELEAGYEFVTESDTEVLLAGYIKEGVQFFSKLNGMYSFAVYDSANNEITIARDHAGIKPLYYFMDGETFAFASETRALFKMIPPALNEIDRESISLYWVFGYIPSPRTLYKNTFVLPRSSYLKFNIASKKLKVSQYSINTITAKDEVEIQELVERKVLSHLIADVPVGLFFSGGTDSSLIASILNKYDRKLETFSLKILGRNIDNRYFSAISSKLNLNSHVFEFSGKEFEECYEDALDSLDAPIADNSIFPTYFISKKAREKVTVVLSGEGGDELFYGYGRQRHLSKMRKLDNDGWTNLDKLFFLLPPFKSKNKIFSYLFIFFKKPLSYYLLTMSPSRGLIDGDAWRRSKEFVKSQVSDGLELDKDLYLENDLLRKLDVATMASSLEGRVPFLDPDIMASANDVTDLYLKSNEQKPVLKRLLEKYLPKELVYRPKSGFGMNLNMFLVHSNRFNDDLDSAIIYLKKEKLCDVKIRNKEDLIRESPNLAFAAVVLYRVLTRGLTRDK